MNPCRVSWGSAGAHRPHFENCWFHEFPCICFGPSGSVALNSQVISLVLKIKSNIIQKSISGPFSISPGSCHDSPYMHEYSLPTSVLFTSLKVPEPFLCRDTLYAMLCFVLLVFFFFILGNFALHELLNKFILILQVSYFGLLPWGDCCCCCCC